MIRSLRWAADFPRLLRRTIRASALATALAMPVGAQRPATRDSVVTDSLRARRLAPLVVSGARLASEPDPRLPQRAVPLDLSAPHGGASPAAELLQRLPGVSVSNDQGSRAQPTLELRGFTLSPVVGVAQGVSVFLDGVRVNEPDAQEVNFDLLPMEAVESAQLVPGASAILGKNTLAGSLDLRTTRGGATPQLRGELSMGGFGERTAHLLASGERAGLDGIVLVKGTREDGYQTQSGGTTRQLFATVGRRGEDADVALSLLYARDRLEEAGSLPESWIGVARRANYTGGDFFRPELAQLSLRAARTLAGARLRGSLFGRRNRIEQLNINVGDVDTRAFVTNASVGGTAEIALSSRLAARPVDVILGAEASHSRVDYRVLAEAHADATLPPDCAADPGSATALCEDARVSGDDAGFYAQGILQASGRLSLLLSARGDYARVPFRDLRDAANDGTSVFWRLSPRAGATYAVADGARLYASVGSAFRAPAALELACATPEASCPLPFALGADPPLRPVVAWNYEVGADWSPRAGSSLALSLFHTDVRDEIVFVSAERAAGYFRNVARTRRDGAELSFAAPVARGGRIFGSYSFVDATYRTPATLASALAGNDVRPGSRFALSPRHRATVGVGAARVVSRAVLDASLSARAVSSSFLRGDEANRMDPLPGYVVGDLRLRSQTGRVAASLFVANLFDRRYALFGVYAENPKGPYGGPAPASAEVERFLTPAYPRSVSLNVSVER